MSHDSRFLRGVGFVLGAAVIALLPACDEATAPRTENEMARFHKVAADEAEISLAHVARLHEPSLLAQESALVETILRTAPPGDTAQLRALLDEGATARVVGAEHPAVAQSFRDLYRVREQLHQARRLSASRDGATRRSAVVTIVLDDHLSDATVAEVVRRTSVPANVIRLHPTRASAQDLERAVNLLRRSRQMFGDLIDQEMRLDLRGDSRTDARRRGQIPSARASQLFAKLTNAPARQVGTLGTFRVLRLKVGPEPRPTDEGNASK